MQFVVLQCLNKSILLSFSLTFVVILNLVFGLFNGDVFGIGFNKVIALLTHI